MPLFGTTHSHFIWLCTDGCGLTCATITWTLHIFAWSTMTKLVIIPWFGLQSIAGRIILVIYSFVIVMALCAHGQAMLTNPGAVPQEAEPPPQDLIRYEEHGGWRKKRWCNRCKAFKPLRAHHDSVTGRCIVKLDHYCPWVNNAVGIFNHKFFLLFVLYTFIQCVLSISILVYVFSNCASFNAHSFDDDDDDDSILEGSTRNHHHLRGIASIDPAFSHRNMLTISELFRSETQTVETKEETEISMKEQCGGLGMLTGLVLVEGILFGLFTLCMLCDQSSMLFSNETKIDRLKGEKHADSKVNEVFGVGGSLRCLLPTVVKFPESAHDEIVGYIVHCSTTHPNKSKPDPSSHSASSSSSSSSPPALVDEFRPMTNSPIIKPITDSGAMRKLSLD